jgi:hypothetical protein
MSKRSMRLLTLVMMILGCMGCEEVVDITDATYRERLVVYGVLDAGEDTISVSFRRTLPINEVYSESKAALSDVTATITVESAGGAHLASYTLTHIGNGNYIAPNAVLHGGNRYRLHATWRGKTVTAQTIVPRQPSVDSVGLRAASRQYEEMPDSMFTAYVVLRPDPQHVYLLTSGTVDPRTGRVHVGDTYGGAPLSRVRDTADDGRLHLIDEWGFYQRRQPISAVLVSYDEQYYEFQRTYYNGNDGGPFGSGTDTVWWTVEGDGIGLFIGRRMDTYRVQ